MEQQIKIIREALELIIAKSQFYSDCHEEELAKGLDKTLDPEGKQFCYINKAANLALQALVELEQPVNSGREGLYYLRNKNAGYLGNSYLWWGEKGGYTAYINGAKKFTKKVVESKEKENPEKWKAYKCQDIDAKLHLIFDSQDERRLGTNENGWGFDYALSQVKPSVDKSKITNIITRAINYTLTECVLDDAGHHNLGNGKKDKLIKQSVADLIEIIKE